MNFVHVRQKGNTVRQRKRSGKRERSIRTDVRHKRCESEAIRLCLLLTSYSERENTMDTEKFIETVKINPVLYDPRHKDFKNMAKKAEVWERIAREMNEKSEALRIKWKGLKDGYTKYKKNGNSLMGGSKSYTNWCWGPHLQFLDDFQKRKSHTSDTGVQDVDSSSLPPLVPFKSTQDSETSLQSFLPTFSGYVPTKIDEDVSERTKEDDSIEHLFNSYAETFRTFSLKTRATMKVQMAKLFADAELIEHDIGPIQSPMCSIISVFSASKDENSNGVKNEVLPINMTIPQYTTSMDSAQIPDSGSGITTRRATKAFQSVERQTNQHDDHEATQSDHSENSRTSTPTKLGGNKENSRKNQKRPVDASAINDVIRKLRKISDDCNQYSNEFDVFCDSLAIQLKKMPIDRALICQEKLQSVMTQERLYQVTQTEQSNSYDYDQSQIAGSSNTYQYMKSSPPPDPEDKPGYYSET
ncbi:uncharacterized protein LOC123307256 isoform X1 [Coccinella septempunctata]|uniref:uncharacterized protein LOC123307256 isoform X1 n=1 Tax=Coccinella septempunctata TaxID=41139 RepID=UPI001D086F0A|nr:uncharacterized protein LOC123307256 isoform X1 [Coccinella septempunctata]